jgi:hypothetical protein
LIVQLFLVVGSSSQQTVRFAQLSYLTSLKPNQTSSLEDKRLLCTQEMATPLMWDALELHQKICDHMLPIRLRWNSLTRRARFCPMGKWEQMWYLEATILFPILGVGSFLTDIIFLVSSSTDNPLRREILDSDQALITRAVLSLVYFGGCALIIGITLWGEELSMIENAALQFEEHMKRRKYRVFRNLVVQPGC